MEDRTKKIILYSIIGAICVTILGISIWLTIIYNGPISEAASVININQSVAMYPSGFTDTSPI